MVGPPPVVNRRDGSSRRGPIIVLQFVVTVSQFLFEVSQTLSLLHLVLVWRTSKQMPCQGHVIWIALLTPSPRTLSHCAWDAIFYNCFIRRCFGGLTESLIFLEALTKSVISSQQPPD